MPDFHFLAKSVDTAEADAASRAVTLSFAFQALYRCSAAACGVVRMSGGGVVGGAVVGGGVQHGGVGGAVVVGALVDPAVGAGAPVPPLPSEHPAATMTAATN